MAITSKEFIFQPASQPTGSESEPVLSVHFTRQVEAGFPVEFIEMVLRRLGFTSGEIYSLVIPARTLKHRKAKQQHLSLEETERAIRLQRIALLSGKIFGSPEKAFRWLRTHQQRLDGRTPLAMLRTEVGGNLVEEMLYQIDEGIYV